MTNVVILLHLTPDERVSVQALLSDSNGHSHAHVRLTSGVVIKAL